MNKIFRSRTWLFAVLVGVGLMVSLLSTTTGVALAGNVVNQTFPISVIFNNPCNGEDVNIQANANLVIKETSDGNGGFHLSIHENINGSGIGQTSGAKYAIMNVANTVERYVPAGLREFSFVIQLKLVSQGSADNFDLVITQNLTINANGDVTVSRFDFDSTCHG